MGKLIKRKEVANEVFNYLFIPGDTSCPFPGKRGLPQWSQIPIVKVLLQNLLREKGETPEQGRGNEYPFYRNISFVGTGTPGAFLSARFPCLPAGRLGKQESRNLRGLSVKPEKLIDDNSCSFNFRR